ncbi:hypothetical protein Tdes44962_MAKER09065 [Teratosphaeria destructans]|uniref:Uncharacterized protein n=1 Tax=Teratosphaeria destructans TaxID=418781 RepID=A0A9W7W3W5_9PEZI|nr:hypothetical protein Tdes44962_MAKER09065 [Teratosphaeria destructans]
MQPRLESDLRGGTETGLEAISAGRKAQKGGWKGRQEAQVALLDEVQTEPNPSSAPTCWGIGERTAGHRKRPAWMMAGRSSQAFRMQSNGKARRLDEHMIERLGRAPMKVGRCRESLRFAIAPARQRNSPGPSRTCAKPVARPPMRTRTFSRFHARTFLCAEAGSLQRVLASDAIASSLHKRRSGLREHLDALIGRSVT